MQAWAPVIIPPPVFDPPVLELIPPLELPELDSPPLELPVDEDVSPPVLVAAPVDDPATDPRPVALPPVELTDDTALVEPAPVPTADDPFPPLVTLSGGPLEQPTSPPSTTPRNSLRIVPSLWRQLHRDQSWTQLGSNRLHHEAPPPIGAGNQARRSYGAQAQQ